MSYFHPKLVTTAGLLLALSAFCIAPTPASAQHPCQDDALRLCNRFIPNQGQIATCLRRYRASLAPACRALFTSKATTKKKKRRARHG